ncbi:hypothetical protein TNCT_216981, partial [Trichonephila clavata]
MSVFKDSFCLRDVCPYTGEHASVKHIVEDNMTCLRPAGGHIVSKAAVIPNHLDQEKYNDQMGLREYLVETEESLVPSFTKEDRNAIKLIKNNADEFMEEHTHTTESRLMAELSQGHEKLDLSYLDNLVIFSENWDSPVNHINNILEQNGHLTIKLVK